MEASVLNYLKFEMTAPTAKCFLRSFPDLFHFNKFMMIISVLNFINSFLLIIIGDLLVLHKRVMRYCYIVSFWLKWPIWQFTCVIAFADILLFFMQDPALHLEFLANYIAELSLLEYSLLSYPPSLVAASAIFLAKFVLQPTKCPWVGGIGNHVALSIHILLAVS